MAFTRKRGEHTVFLSSMSGRCRGGQGEKGTRVFGLGQVTDMVNQEQTKANRFKIKLKI